MTSWMSFVSFTTCIAFVPSYIFHASTDTMNIAIKSIRSLFITLARFTIGKAKVCIFAMITCYSFNVSFAVTLSRIFADLAIRSHYVTITRSAIWILFESILTSFTLPSSYIWLTRTLASFFITDQAY